MSRPRMLQDRSVELALAIALFVGSAALVYDAYEARGKQRPFWARLAPMP